MASNNVSSSSSCSFMKNGIILVLILINLVMVSYVTDSSNRSGSDLVVVGTEGSLPDPRSSYLDLGSDVFQNMRMNMSVMSTLVESLLAHQEEMFRDSVVKKDQKLLVAS